MANGLKNGDVVRVWSDTELETQKGTGLGSGMRQIRILTLGWKHVRVENMVGERFKLSRSAFNRIHAAAERARERTEAWREEVSGGRRVAGP